VLAAVSDYAGTDLWDLPIARTGAEALRDVLVMAHGFHPEDVTLLDEPDAATIAAAVERAAAQATAADALLFYYAGHAERLDGRTVLAPRGYREGDPGLPLAAIATAFRTSQAGAKLRLLETCFAGEPDAHPGAGPVLAACGPDEVASASDRLGLGLFSAALVRGLAGAAEPTLPALAAYVAARTASWAARLGSPQEVVAGGLAEAAGWRLGPPGARLACDVVGLHPEDAFAPGETLAERLVELGGRIALTEAPYVASDHAGKLLAATAWLERLRAWADRRGLSPGPPTRLAGTPAAMALGAGVLASPVGALFDWDIRLAEAPGPDGLRRPVDIREPGSYPPSTLVLANGLAFTVVSLAAGLALWIYHAEPFAVLDASPLPPYPLDLAPFEAALDEICLA
jgi:hypothetical protein